MLNFNRIMKVMMVICVFSLFTLNNAYSQTKEPTYEGGELGEAEGVGISSLGQATIARQAAEQARLDAMNKSGITGKAAETKDYEKLKAAEAARANTAAEKSKAEAKLKEALAAQQNVEKAQKAFNSATTPEAKASAQAALVAAQAAAPKASELDTLQKDFNKADNDDKKAASSLASAQTKVGKAAQKEAGQEASKAAKEVRDAEKALEKAKKSGDATAINNAQEKLDKAKEKSIEATRKANDFDGSKAVAAAEANLAAAKGVEAKELALAETRRLQVVETGARHVTCNVEANVFKKLTCKATMFLSDVRVLVYVLGGFGLIAFTFKAIFGKMDWKHLGQLGLSLFLLSMMVPFITYFTSNNDSKDYSTLQYGEFLPYDTAAILRSTDLDSRKKKEVDVEAVNTTKEKYGLKDILGSVKAGIAAVKGAYDTVNTAKATVSEVKKNANAIGNAIKNHEGGLGGLVATIDNVAAAGGNMVYAGTQMANAVNRNVGAVANNIDDMKATDQQREENAKKRAAGGFTNEIDAWMKDEYGIAADVNATTQKVNEKSGQIRTATSNVSNATKQGATMGGGMGSTGGDILGGIFGVATAVGEGTNIGTNWNGTAAQKAAEQAKYTGVQSKDQRDAQIDQAKAEIKDTPYTIDEKGNLVSTTNMERGTYVSTELDVIKSVAREKKDGKDVYTFNGQEYATASEAVAAATKATETMGKNNTVYNQLSYKDPATLTEGEKQFMASHEENIAAISVTRDEDGMLHYNAPKKVEPVKVEPAPAERNTEKDVATSNTNNTGTNTDSNSNNPASGQSNTSGETPAYSELSPIKIEKMPEPKVEISYNVKGDTMAVKKTSTTTFSNGDNKVDEITVEAKKLADGYFYMVDGLTLYKIDPKNNKRVEIPMTSNEGKEILKQLNN